MINPEVVPVYAIIDYVWQLLKDNTSMTEADYSGRIPVIPASQQPEFTELDKPFVVYAWTESPTGILAPHRTGQISFAIYASKDRDISKISNIISTTLGKFDVSASYINQWKTSDSNYGEIRFTTLSSGAFDGPSPETQEGGRRSGVVMIRYSYIAEYAINTPGRLANQP